MKCPSCGALDVRTSKRQPGFAIFYTVRGYERYRCRECRHSFWDKPPKVNDEERIRRKRQRAWGAFIQSRKRRGLIEIALFVGMLLVFYVAIRYLVNKTDTPPPSGILLLIPTKPS